MPAPCLMVQGTASNAGKSLLATALCRHFARCGLRVAPFKSQNMALNSAVTADGGEIGRAQAVQAQAAGVTPTTDMNPVLLKPKADCVAQVIIHGRPRCDLDSRSYREDFLPQAFEAATQSLTRLRANYDLVVMEGAGSPAEINLKSRDIANMKIAAWAGARVLLVGNMAHGGAFASLLGTVRLLEQWERDLVVGLIVNRCPWEKQSLKSSIGRLEQEVHKPLLGVLPDLPVEIEAEDSLSLPSNQPGHPERVLQVVVPRLPRISNFTDFDPLRSQPGVTVSFLEKPPANPPHALILPGTKNTVDDLLWLKELGWQRPIQEWAQNGLPVAGICGGFQMLGQELRDPHRLESDILRVEGLGLLPLVTEFSPTKITQQVRARVEGGRGWLSALTGIELEGYEIRAGRLHYLPEGRPLLKLQRIPGQTGPDNDGAAVCQGQVWGLHLHGVFHNPQFLQAFLGFLRRKAGHPDAGNPVNAAPVSLDAEAAFDALADSVEKHLALNAICYELGL